jgi:hypothetical protein
MGITEQPDACASAAASYRRKFDWPCTAAGHAVWTLAGEALDAVDVPELFGPGIVEALRHRPLAVIEVPGEPERWRFLVRPGAPRPHLLARELARYGAVHRKHAEVIELPPTRTRGGELRWLLGPDAIPPLPEVAGALAAVIRLETERSRAEQEHSRRF